MSSRRQSSRIRKKKRESSEDIGRSSKLATSEEPEERKYDSGEDMSATDDETKRRQAAEMQEEADRQKDVSLLKLLEELDDYEPIIPDVVLDHYFTKAGFDCPDDRIKKLIALSAQKFISDVAEDAFQYSRLRQQRFGSNNQNRARPDFRNNVLTMDDLVPALEEYGINVKRPQYYI